MIQIIEISDEKSKGGTSLKKGGAGEACNGEIVKPDDQNYNGFLVTGLVKTYDELLHDFGKYFNSTTLSTLKAIYNRNISVFINNLNSLPSNDELNKIKEFIRIKFGR